MGSVGGTLRRHLGEWGRRKVRDRSGARRPVLERLEERIAMSTDIAMLSATTRDSRSVDVSYRIDGDGGAPLEVAIYRSADANFDASDVRLVGQTTNDPAAI